MQGQILLTATEACTETKETQIREEGAMGWKCSR